jgi:hypothetical protein
MSTIGKKGFSWRLPDSEDWHEIDGDSLLSAAEGAAGCDNLTAPDRASWPREYIIRDSRTGRAMPIVVDRYIECSFAARSPKKQGELDDGRGN